MPPHRASGHRIWVDPSITAYVPSGPRVAVAKTPEEKDAAIWLDLRNPDQAILDGVGARVGAELPTLDDMEEIESSSRLYTENGVAFLTAVIPFGMEGAEPRLAPVAFIISPDKLVTIRYHEHKAFATYPQRAQFVSIGCASSVAVLLGLLDAITDRIADILERGARDIDALSRSIFRSESGAQAKSRNFQALLEAIGRQGDLVSKLRESLASTERLFAFLSQLTLERRSPKDVREFVKTLARDARSLIDHTEFLSQKITLLLDATLGMISIEQNGIIKFFSVVAVVFLPPTLIASIYGMNFAFLPGLEWRYGYPLSVIGMILSAVLPYLFFRWRGWL